jgi:hypothetical protein
MSLILPQVDNTLDMWLDNKLSNTDVFSDLLKPHIPQDLIVQKIDKPSSYQPVDEAFIIEQD